nr:hypothetical protein MACL_00002407 [Theileria orientalis]
MNLNLSPDSESLCKVRAVYTRTPALYTP